jgi:hypothetical protein
MMDPTSEWTSLALMVIQRFNAMKSLSIILVQTEGPGGFGRKLQNLDPIRINDIVHNENRDPVML